MIGAGKGVVTVLIQEMDYVSIATCPEGFIP